MKKTELTPWNEIFEIRLYDYAHVQERLISWIQHYTPQGGSILEVGFGSGWTSLLLAQLGYNVTGIDNDQTNWQTVSDDLQLLEHILDFPFHPRFFFTDLFKAPLTQLDYILFDVGFSDGLFEHFDNQRVIEGLEILKKCCETVIIDVPSWKERNAEIQRGDEIYRTNREWKRLIQQAGFKIKQVYGSVVHCPRWIRAGVPPFIARKVAHHFTTKVGFVI